MTDPQSPIRGHVAEGVGFAGAAGALVTLFMLSGCPGTLDPNQFPTNGTGGNTGSGGTGGSGPTGGAPGTGGTALDCTGGNEGTAILTNSCATLNCHIPGAGNDGVTGGLDLTPDANIASRLVGVMSVGTADNGSMCVGQGPYLDAHSNPATGLFIDKFTMSRPPCGVEMPADSAFFLTPTQQGCLKQWATTLTSP
jgi:hypothetical protein